MAVEPVAAVGLKIVMEGSYCHKVSVGGVNDVAAVGAVKISLHFIYSCLHFSQPGAQDLGHLSLRCRTVLAFSVFFQCLSVAILTLSVFRFNAIVVLDAAPGGGKGPEC